MIFLKSDFRHIKWGLLVFVLALGASYLMIAASNTFIAHAQRDQQEAKRQINEARARLVTAEEDHANIRAYALEYELLLKRNILGDGLRLDWIEGMNKIHEQGRSLGFIDFKYAIAPQQPYILTPASDGGNLDLYRSDMTLQFDLLHEEQLTEFFDILRTSINGQFVLDHCALERSASLPDDDDNGVGQQIKAKCTGGWLTMKNRNSK